MSDQVRDRSPIDKDRKESRFKERNRRSGGGKSGGGGSNSRRAPPDRRVFISNIPFEMKWQEVKDMFRDQVGDVTYVELFNDESDKPRGCGILEFATEELAKQAVEKMHRHELRGRKLVVKEDFDSERDKYGRIISGSGRRDRDRDRDHGRDRGSSSNQSGGASLFGSNTYGLSPQFLESLGIEGSLHNRLFVANLSYSVDEKKLREVFRLAGRVVMAELNRDKEGKSRGHAVIEFDHPVEAVQAISMLNNQTLFDRKMTVRFDKQPGPTPEELSQLPSRLPEGLLGVGMGLGSGGNPLTEVAKNLPNAQATSPQPNNSGPMGGNMGGPMGGNAMGGAMGGAGDNGGAGNLLGQLGELSALSKLISSSGGGGNLLSALASNLTGGGNANNASGGGMGNQQGNMGGGGLGGMNSGGGGGMGRGPMGGPGGMGGGMGGGGGGYSTSSGGGAGFGGSNDMGGGPQGGYGGGNQGMSGGGGGGVTRSDTVAVRNLPPDCNWQILREGFAHCGEIKYAEMKDRGTGMIRFMTEADAERAVSMMHNQSIAGRTIEVRLY